VLGVTNKDLYAEPLNFVFGQASLNGRIAIVSVCRLDPTFYGQPADKDLFTQRAVKEAVHEVGHMLGFRHCADPVCVMHFSNSINEVDSKSAKLCWKCELTLRSERLKKKSY
jgi:archaemetzincin